MVDRPLCPHAPPMPLHDSLHDRQTDAGALELLGAVEPLEDAKQLVGVFHLESRTVVPDEVRQLARAGGTADLDRRLGARARELPGVADEVRQDLPDEGAVGESRRQGHDRDRHAALRLEAPQLFHRRLRQGGHVDAGLLQVASPQPREREEVVDELPHLPGIRADHAEDALAFGIEVVGVVLEEDARIAVNGAQRRAEVVGDGVREGPECLVRRLELQGALLQLLLSAFALGRVPAHTRHPQGAAVVGAVHLAPRAEDVHAAVRPDHPEFRVVGRIGLPGVRDLTRHPVAVVGVHHAQGIFVPSPERARLEPEERMDVVVPDDGTLDEVPAPGADARGAQG